MTDSSYRPVPGTIGLVEVHGEVGKLIHVGQYLAETPLGRWWRKNDEPPYEHAFMYLGEVDGDPKVIEAEPGGARVVSLSEYDGIHVYWCEAIAAQFTTEQLAGVADLAHTFEGVKYSFLDYFALAAHRLCIFPLYPVLKAFVRSTKHMICSQLADAAYAGKGLHVFTDGRWAGDVMPMDFYLRDQELQIGK